MPSASAWKARRKDSLDRQVTEIQKGDLRFMAAGLLLASFGFFYPKIPLTIPPDMLEWTYGGMAPVPNQVSLIS